MLKQMASLGSTSHSAIGSDSFLEPWSVIEKIMVYCCCYKIRFDGNIFLVSKPSQMWEIINFKGSYFLPPFLPTHPICHSPLPHKSSHNIIYSQDLLCGISNSTIS
jgi:hypothetical protein